jgi:DNA polymerase
MTLLFNAKQLAMLENMGLCLNYLPKIRSSDEASQPLPAMPVLKDKASPVVVKTSAPIHVSTSNWETLEKQVRECHACELSKTRQNTVFGVGSLPSPITNRVDWMIIGEAPGENEDMQGEPFVGQAGRLLDAMLAALGLSRNFQDGQAASLYIANVLKCRPPGNRNPQTHEIAHCSAYLFRQIELLQPKLIVAMGKFGAQTLLSQSHPDIESTPLGRLRGQVFNFGNIPLVVTYHPAYLLRNLKEKSKVWADLCLAQSIFNRP